MILCLYANNTYFQFFRLLDSWNKGHTHRYLNYVCAYTLLVRDDPTCIFDHIGKVIFWSKLPVICNYAHYAYASMRVTGICTNVQFHANWLKVDFYGPFHLVVLSQLLLPVSLVRLWLVTDRVPEIGFLGTRNLLKNSFKASWTMVFFIFCQIFSI